MTTPQDIALMDARRGAEMFKKVDIPVSLYRKYRILILSPVWKHLYLRKLLPLKINTNLDTNLTLLYNLNFVFLTSQIQGAVHWFSLFIEERINRSPNKYSHPQTL